MWIHTLMYQPQLEDSKDFFDISSAAFAISEKAAIHTVVITAGVNPLDVDPLLPSYWKLLVF